MTEGGKEHFESTDLYCHMYGLFGPKFSEQGSRSLQMFPKYLMSLAECCKKWLKMCSCLLKFIIKVGMNISFDS